MTTQTSITAQLSTLWIATMVNLVFADVLSIFVELVDKNTLGGIPDDVKTTMAIAAAVTNIPILMIYLSRVLPYKWNRIANIAAALFTIVYVVAPEVASSGSTLPHYFVIASVEVVLLLVIVAKAWKWPHLEDLEDITPTLQ
jgi:hypothetical protein